MIHYHSIKWNRDLWGDETWVKEDLMRKKARPEHWQERQACKLWAWESVSVVRGH